MACLIRLLQFFTGAFLLIRMQNKLILLKGKKFNSFSPCCTIVGAFPFTRASLLKQMQMNLYQLKNVIKSKELSSICAGKRLQPLNRAINFVSKFHRTEGMYMKTPLKGQSTIVFKIIFGLCSLKGLSAGRWTEQPLSKSNFNLSRVFLNSAGCYHRIYVIL